MRGWSLQLPVMPEVAELPSGTPPLPAWLPRLAAAVETAVPASLAAVLWFAIHSFMLREPWWSKFNVAAGPFFGDRVFYLGLGRATVAGAALLVVLYSLSGMLYGLLASGRSVARAFALAAVWLASWHFLAQHFLWPRLHPAAPPYFPMTATVPAHLAAAILLARFPDVFRRLSAFGPDGAPVTEAAAAREEPATGDGSEGFEAGPENQHPAPPGSADC